MQMVATLRLARAGVGLAGEAGGRLELDRLGGLGRVGAGDGGGGDGGRLVAEAARVLAVALLAKVAGLDGLLTGRDVQEGALVGVLARAGLGEELARHGAVVGVGRLVVLGLGVVHDLEALVVRRRLGLVLGLEDGRRVEDRGAALNLLQVADELAVERVLNAVVGELPVEVVERGQDGPLGDDGDLLAVGLGRHRLLGRAALRQALPEHVGDFRQRAHDLHGQ